MPRHLHKVSKTDISDNALKVLNQLNHAGYEAYLVGGSVRDLLIGKSPKDFDITTDATPNQIRKLFRNARIIGRRFKLVHIIFHKEIIEVATFRSQNSIDEKQITNERGLIIRDNAFGTHHDDAFRRDFTINSLYYTIQDNIIIDYTNGFHDIKQKLIRIIGDPDTRYQEDPVRMLRAIRFSAKLDFTISPETKSPILKLCGLITHISSSRLFDEVVKIYQSGFAVNAHQQLIDLGLFAFLFPQVKAALENSQHASQFLLLALQSTDKRIEETKPVTPAFIYAALLWFPLLTTAKNIEKTGTDPLPALEQAMSFVISEQNKIVMIPKRFTQVMREIWLLQFRFSKRLGQRAYHILEHPRFRAAYDFMVLRALAGDESIELADWWTKFQEETPETQHEMINALSNDTGSKPNPKKNRRSSKKRINK